LSPFNIYYSFVGICFFIYQDKVYQLLYAAAAETSGNYYWSYDGNLEGYNIYTFSGGEIFTATRGVFSNEKF
jgi:hypothetical protein